MSNSQPYNERELLLRIAEGDEKAFQELFEQYWPLMYANVLQFTKDPEIARDLTQEIFLKVWTSRELLGEVKVFKAWLCTVARNRVLDTLRKRVLLIENEEYLLNFMEDSSVIPDHILEAKELEKHIQEAIAGLPEQVRVAFTLKRIEGLTHEQVSSRMQISTITSRSYITRAVNAIRHYLETKTGLLISLSILFF